MYSNFCTCAVVNGGEFFLGVELYLHSVSQFVSPKREMVVAELDVALVNKLSNNSVSLCNALTYTQGATIDRT